MKSTKLHTEYRDNSRIIDPDRARRIQTARRNTRRGAPSTVAIRHQLDALQVLHGTSVEADGDAVIDVNHDIEITNG